MNLLIIFYKPTNYSDLIYYESYTRGFTKFELCAHFFKSGNRIPFPSMAAAYEYFLLVNLSIVK